MVNKTKSQTTENRTTKSKKAESKTTTSHNEIKEWVEKRGGKPAIIKGTEDSEGGGLLRINFPGYKEENLKEISWDQFFEVFDDRNLKFLYQEETADGGESRFFKLITRNG